MRPIWAALCAALFTACTTGADGDGFVLIDAAAREAGHAVELNGIDHTRVLPTALPLGTAATVTIGPDEHSIFLGAGELLRITADDLVFGFLGEDFSAELLHIEADADAREDLAYLSDADLLPGGLLASDDLFILLSDLDDPEGIGDVSPVPLDEAPANTPSDGHTLPNLRTAGTGSPSSAAARHVITLTFGASGDSASTEVIAATAQSAEADLYCNPLHVGVYTSGDDCLILDAAGDAQYCGTHTKRMWTSEGSSVVLHEFASSTKLALSADMSRVVFPDGRAFTRLGRP